MTSDTTTDSLMVKTLCVTTHKMLKHADYPPKHRCFKCFKCAESFLDDHKSWNAYMLYECKVFFLL